MPTRTVDVGSLDELRGGVQAFRAGAPAGALILIGGADFTDPDERRPIEAFFDVVAAHCAAAGIAVIDGGTESGVMQLIAAARRAAARSFPLIGVAPRGAFDRRTRTGAPIEPALDHDVVLTVPGDRFGDETSWLFAAADDLHGSLAPAIVVNGGELARHEAEHRLAQGGIVVAVAGSGRAADELARAVASDPALRASGRLRTIAVGADAAALAAALEGEA